MRSVTKQRGFTLIEAMVSITLGLLVLASVTGIFVSTSRGYREDTKSAHIHEDLSLAMAQLQEDIEMAGFWTARLNPTSISVAASGNLPAITNECWKIPATVPADTRYSLVNTSTGNTLPVAFGNNFADGTTAHAAFPCIAVNDYQPGTDVIAIRRVMGASTISVASGGADPTSCDHANEDKCNRVYLRANPNSNVTTLFRPTSAAPNPTGSQSVGSPYDDWEYRVAVYYVRKCSLKVGADCAGNDGDDSVPTLCRYVLQGGSPPAMAEECIAQGIEQLQLELGMDTDGDGTPNYYDANIGGSINLRQMRAVRISLLARSVDLPTATNAPADTLLGSTAAYQNAKTYTLAGGSPNGYTAVPADHFYRKLATGIAVIRNWASLCTNYFSCGGA